MIKWAKTNVCVHADSVQCVGKIEQNPGAADAKWTGQVEDLKRYPSYQNAVGLDGEAIEFEWKNFPGFTTLTILKEIQMDLERKNIEPENFKDRNDENCISNAEKVKNYSKRFLPVHWTFFLWVQVRRRDGTVAHLMDSGTVKPTKLYSNSKKLVILFSQQPVLLSRAMLKQRRCKSTIHFNGEFMNTELLFQTTNSVNQVSIYAADTN